MDMLAVNEVNWPCNGDSWRSGGTATNNEKLMSFDFFDEILRSLVKKEAFPNLKAIVVAGHSAGGQFVTRYEMANQIHEKIGVPIAYVVANPSSYAYPDPERPEGDNKEFRAFRDARNCTTYDNWPYGLKGRSGYSARLRRSIEEAAGLAPCHIPGRRARHVAACRLRFFLSRHGSRREPSRSGPGFRELRKSEIQRPAETYGRPSLWPQRALHVHNGTGAPDPVSETAVAFQIKGHSYIGSVIRLTILLVIATVALAQTATSRITG